MKKYTLLKFHMDCNPDYMFDHAVIAGMLSSNDPLVNTYEGYVKQCNHKGISYYNEETYTQFMTDCGRIPADKFPPVQPLILSNVAHIHGCTTIN